MAFIELTMLQSGEKTLVNLDQVLRLGPLTNDGEITGSYIVLTGESGIGGGKTWIRVNETPSFIEERLVWSRILIIR